MTDEIAKELSAIDLKGKAWDKRVRELGLKPGQVIPGTASYVPWIKEDLDPNDTVTFVAQDVLGTQGGMEYAENQKGFKLDVNGLTCFIRVNELNTINRFFYSRYESMLYGNIQLEEFKRHGPKRPMPWGGNDWTYLPYAASFAMDMDGKSIKNYWIHPEWYEFDRDGIPVKINNMKKIASLYFDGDLDFTFTKLQIAELLVYLAKVRIKNAFKKILRRK